MINLDEARLRAERAEYAIDRIVDKVEAYQGSITDQKILEALDPLFQGIARIGNNLYVEHRKETTRDGVEVCVTCPANEYGAFVGWDHLHPRA